MSAQLTLPNVSNRNVQGLNFSFPNYQITKKKKKKKNSLKIVILDFKSYQVNPDPKITAPKY